MKEIMKKKSYYIYLLLLSVMIGASSCNYLDVVPDEIDTEEDAFPIIRQY